MSREHWITGAFLVLLIVAAFTAHAGAITISSSDKVEISTKNLKDATTWAKVEAGSIKSTSLFGTVTVKLSLTGATEKEKVEPIVQVKPDANLVVKGNYVGNEVDYVQVDKERIEGYYAYGKSNTYPWGFYWCVYDLNGKPFVVYSEFSTRSVWYNYISVENVGKLNDAITVGACPDIGIIQQAVGR